MNNIGAAFAQMHDCAAGGRERGTANPLSRASFVCEIWVELAEWLDCAGD